MQEIRGYKLLGQDKREKDVIIDTAVGSLVGRFAYKFRALPVPLRCWWQRASDQDPEVVHWEADSVSGRHPYRIKEPRNLVVGFSIHRSSAVVCHYELVRKAS